MSSLNKVGNRHKSYQIVKHKNNGKYVRQRDHTRLNKIKHIIKQIEVSSGEHLSFLQERLKFWQLS
jgi:hypothetical protein